MHALGLLLYTLLAASGALAGLGEGVINPHKRAAELKNKHSKPSRVVTSNFEKRDSTKPPKFLTPKTQKFAVNGTGVPEIHFDIGESYAGRLPVSSPNATNATDNELFFWFFPTDNEAGSKDILIWLNGGPGCTSMFGLLQENGPFLWQPGTYAPQPNPFSYTNLTNTIWVDQPVGTGLSIAGAGVPATIKNEDDVSRDFAAFWKNFVDTFDMQGYNVYIAGESYAGMYVSYIGSHFLDLNDTTYYNLKGINIIDPAIAYSVVGQAAAMPFLNRYNNVMNINDSLVADVTARAEACGYNAFQDLALTFPPAGKFPSPLSLAKGNISVDTQCDIIDDIFAAAIYINPCFNIYHITDFCPFPNNELGFPTLGDGPNNYFNRTDVQDALNLKPYANFAACGNPDLGLEGSEPASYGALPSVIERTNNVVVGNGNLDFLIMSNSTLGSLNNMTWNGAQGFSSSPFADKFFVPYNPTIGLALNEIFYQSNIPTIPVGLVGGGGYYGTTHTERGLTFVAVDQAGHQVPSYAPGAAYRQLEFLLGRINSLTQVGEFTTHP